MSDRIQAHNLATLLEAFTSGIIDNFKFEDCLDEFCSSSVCKIRSIALAATCIFDSSRRYRNIGRDELPVPVSECVDRWVIILRSSLDCNELFLRERNTLVQTMVRVIFSHPVEKNLFWPFTSKLAYEEWLSSAMRDNETTLDLPCADTRLH